MPDRTSSSRGCAQRLSRAIRSSLTGTDSKTALKALFDAVVAVASRMPVESPEAIAIPEQLLRRSRGRSFRVAADPQLQAYIHGLVGYHTIDQVVSKCRGKFGARRTPSRSAIARYLRSLKTRNSTNRKGRK